MSILARQGQVESVHDFDDADTRVALASRFKAELKVALASEEEYRRRERTLSAVTSMSASRL